MLRILSYLTSRTHPLNNLASLEKLVTSLQCEKANRLSDSKSSNGFFMVCFPVDL